MRRNNGRMLDCFNACPLQAHNTRSAALAVLAMFMCMAALGAHAQTTSTAPFLVDSTFDLYKSGETAVLVGANMMSRRVRVPRSIAPLCCSSPAGTPHTPHPQRACP